MALRQPFIHKLAPLVVLLAILSGTLISCRTTSGLSLEEAQQISGAGEQGLTAPPRAGVTDIINTRYLEAFADETCKNEPPESVDLDQVIARIKNDCKIGGHSWGAQVCLSDKLFEAGRRAMNRGQYREAIDLIQTAIKSQKVGRGGAERYRGLLAASYAAIGDFSAARWNMGGGNSRGYMSQSGKYQVKVNYQVGKAALEKARGNYRAAEKHYRQAQKYCDEATMVVGAPGLFVHTETRFLPDFGEVPLMRGRPVEAELVLRTALRRSDYGNIDPVNRMRSLAGLSRLYYQQGRYGDAETMAKAAIGGYHIYGFNCSQMDLNDSRRDLARILLDQDRPTEALEQFEAIKLGMQHTPQIFKVRFANDPDWAYALLAGGDFVRAETMLAGALGQARGQFGGGHHQTTEIQGLLAVAQYRQSKTKAAGYNFKEALPTLLAHSHAADAQGGARVASHRRLARIVEAYMAYVAYGRDGTDAAEETFSLADVVRGQSVQQAVIASSMRIAARDKRLADLVRREQDAGKKISALKAVLLNALSQSVGGGQIGDLQGEIETLQQARSVILDEIEKDFPAYAELTRPRPKQLAEIRAALEPDEALLAYYLGSENAFVWSVSGKGASGFAVLPRSTVEIAQRVASVRKSLVPTGPRLEDLPRFDMAAAQQLYRTLMEPVRADWKDARHLIIVPHGQLGHLPFGLLVTAERVPKSIRQLPLAGYRKVPWLIRDYSITVLPSAGSLISLRALPEADPQRRAYAGFGDPVFDPDQSAHLAAAPPTPSDIATRAIRITDTASLDERKLSSATLEMLQPLPDTRAEVLAIGKTLKAGRQQDVFLGKAASETNVKQLDLSNRRVLVFATHGLVPGDLDGLRQPALALSSPTATGEIKNDGLLTMGEIMGLRLNADWVVLSACNTASGQGAGSEAVSGLGQAFFYAGTRALLVSNWPVESASARMLTTELFKQQEADPKLSRAVALQKSMLKLLDTGVYRDTKTNQALYAYAHPMFWAPFSLVGEGRR